MNVQTMVVGYRDEIVDRLGTLVAINSKEGNPEPGAPFGQGPKQALRTALGMLEQDGFHTRNLDDYIGYAELGEGKEVIGIIGHLDIVPAVQSDGWDTDPFVMTEKDGILYGTNQWPSESLYISRALRFLLSSLGLKKRSMSGWSMIVRGYFASRRSRSYALTKPGPKTGPLE